MASETSLIPKAQSNQAAFRKFSVLKKGRRKEGRKGGRKEGRKGGREGGRGERRK